MNGETMIIAAPSSDDGSGSGRADTYMTPSDYDPTDSSKVPPDIEDNGDPNLYFKYATQAFPGTPAITIVTTIISLTFYGLPFVDETGAPLGTNGPWPPGYKFVPDPDIYYTGWVTYQTYFQGPGAEAYAASLVGLPVGIEGAGPVINGHASNIYLSASITGSTSMVIPATPPGLVAASIATQDPGSDPTSDNPANIKMGALWWIRKWSNGDPQLVQ